jgi:predicted Zn-dependent peptidase
MLFKGTRRRTARRISQDIEGVGGYLNAFTGEEQTCFYSRARHDRFAELLDVLVDMLLNSTFDAAEVEKEREVIKEEWAMYRDQPSQYVQELLNATMWPDQPLGRPLTGTERSLDRLTRDTLVRFQQTNYVAQNTIVAAAGNVRHRDVLKAVSRCATRFHSGLAPRFSPAVEAQAAPRVKLHTRRTEQTQFALGVRTCSRHDPRRFAVRLLNTLLAESMSSRLFQLLREDLGLVYSVYSAASFFDDTGDLVISAGVDTDKLRRVLRLIVAELRRFTGKPPGRAELRRAIDYTVGQIELSLEGTENQMNWVGEMLGGYGRVIRPEQTIRRLAATRAEEIRAVARTFFRGERMNLALISPLKRDPGLAALLRT